MAKVENVPGRKVTPPTTPPTSPTTGAPDTRSFEGSRERPARARLQPRGTLSSDPGDTLVVDAPAPVSSAVPRSGRWSAGALGLLWVFLVACATGGLVALRLVEAPDLPRQGAAGMLGVLLAIGLAVRSGGPPLPAALLAGALGGAGVATQWEPLLAGAAVGTGVLAACLAVLGTTPAASFIQVVREVVLALAVATAGALAVAGFAVPVERGRFGYTVLALSLGAAIAMVYRLGGGLHGLGRRGLAVGVAVVLVLAVGLAYTEALAQWGSPGMIDRFDTVTGWMRERIGAVPRPIEALVGIPALVWGVSMRTRRRQGWWVCAFGVAATATATTRLLGSDLTAASNTLSALYSLLLGLLLGYALIRTETSLQGPRGRRSRRPDDMTGHRPEPARFGALH